MGGPGIGVMLHQLFGCSDFGSKELEGKKITLIGERPVLQIGLIGSRKSYLNAYFTNCGILIQAGCWIGTIKDFAARVKEKHKDSNFAKEYAAAIIFIESQAKIWGKK